MTSDFDDKGPGRADGASKDLVEIDLNFDTLRRVHADFAPNLCRDGLFIETREPLAPSTVVRFRILLPEEFVLAEGTAVVEWTREEGSIPGLPPGMALRYVTLGGSSQETIDEIVDSHIAAGGFPFELEPSIGEAGEIPTDALAGRGRSTEDPWATGAASGVARTPGDSYRLTVRTVGGPPDEEGGSPDLPVDERTAPSEAETETSAPDEVIPAWLREQAEANSLRLETDPAFETDEVAAPVEEATQPEYVDDGAFELPSTAETETEGDIPAPAEAQDASNGSFEVASVDDREPPGDTTFHSDGGPRADVTVSSDDKARPGRKSRSWLAWPAALVILGALAAAWWFLLGPGATPVAERPEQGSEGVTASTRAEPTEIAALPPVEPSARTTSVPAAGAEPVVEMTPTPPVVVGKPASRVVSVAAAAQEGATVVVIRGDGVFGDDALRLSKLADPPRVLVRIRGIHSGYAPELVEVESPEVQRIRIGYHPEERPPSLYVVLDLTSSAVEVGDSEMRGDGITISVGRR